MGSWQVHWHLAEKQTSHLRTSDIQERTSSPRRAPALLENSRATETGRRVNGGRSPRGPLRSCAWSLVFGSCSQHIYWGGVAISTPIFRGGRKLCHPSEVTELKGQGQVQPGQTDSYTDPFSSTLAQKAHSVLIQNSTPLMTVQWPSLRKWAYLPEGAIQKQLPYFQDLLKEWKRP